MPEISGKFKKKGISKQIENIGSWRKNKSANIVRRKLSDSRRSRVALNMSARTMLIRFFLNSNPVKKNLPAFLSSNDTADSGSVFHG